MQNRCRGTKILCTTHKAPWPRPGRGREAASGALYYVRLRRYRLESPGETFVKSLRRTIYLQKTQKKRNCRGVGVSDHEVASQSCVSAPGGCVAIAPNPNATTTTNTRTQWEHNTFMDTLNEHLKRKLSCDGMFEHPRALISWKDDFTRAYATNVFTCEANRCKLMKVTVAAAKVVPDLPAPRILATVPHENPDFLSPERTSS